MKSEGVEMLRKRKSPPREEGWLRIKKMSRSLKSGADGVVEFEPSANSTTPSAPTKVASQHLLNVASTPPHRGGDSPGRGDFASFSLLPQLYLLVGLLLMAATSAAAQIKTAKPGEQVERQLPSDWKFREWSLDENVSNEIKRIKVCRVEEVCKMRFKEGETPRTRVRNLVVPLGYEDENISISEAFTRQVREALDDLQDKRSVTARFIGYTDDAPLTSRDQQTYENHLSLSKGMEHRVAEAMRDKVGSGGRYRS